MSTFQEMLPSQSDIDRILRTKHDLRRLMRRRPRTYAEYLYPDFSAERAAQLLRYFKTGKGMEWRRGE